MEYDLNNYYLVRHGQSEYNVEGLYQGWAANNPLSSLGRIQVHELAKKIKEQVSIHHIFASDLQRTRETADIIGNYIHLDVNLTPQLRDFRISRLFQGLPIQQMDQDLLFKEWLVSYKQDLEYSLPDGESINQLRSRIKAFASTLNYAHSGQNILIVSHSRVVLELIQLWSGIEFGSSEIDYATLYALTYANHRYELKHD
ncbi:histidine phosphatase family protein [Candidatus Daviesbacteria bacterium]|nr:histidine phosphatase family protein [Candidatus Daviesbacteria bacterium]